ncbi:MAG: hypothetical protein IT245_04700 [Bacteroidia bacterium]|nr:hypothetical protein [Bacteroidia bacterium]
MKSIGSFMAILGLAAIGFGFLDRVPRILGWIYTWGDGAAWAIKLILTVVGGILWFVGRKNEQTAKEDAELYNSPDEPQQEQQ